MPPRKNTKYEHQLEVHDFKQFNQGRAMDGLSSLSWDTWRAARAENSAAWELQRSGVPRKTVLQMVRE